MRPSAIPGSPVGDEPADSEPSISDPHTESGTRTHPEMIAMREGLRGEASEMVKSILAAVLGSSEVWSRDVIEVRVLSCFILHVHSGRGESGTCTPGFDHHALRAAVLHVDSIVPMVHLVFASPLR